MFRILSRNTFVSGRRYIADAPQYSGMVPVLSGERGVNQVTVVGRAGNDAEMRGSEKNPVTIFSVATSQTYRTPEGNFQQFTDWHRISIFRPNLRERIANNVKKGDRVYIKGCIRYSQYTNKEGQNVNAAAIIAEDVINLSRGSKYDENTINYTYEDEGQEK